MRNLFFYLFVHRVSAAPTTKLLEFDFALNRFLIFTAPVVYALAFRALKLDERILGHTKK